MLSQFSVFRLTVLFSAAFILFTADANAQMTYYRQPDTYPSPTSPPGTVQAPVITGSTAYSEPATYSAPATVQPPVITSAAPAASNSYPGERMASTSSYTSSTGVTISNPNVSTYGNPPAAAPAPNYSSNVAVAANTTYTSGPTYRPTAAAGNGMENLPSYQYDPTLDPRNNPTPVKPKPIEDPNSPYNSTNQYMSLDTHAGLDVGLSLGYYRYKEPNLFSFSDGSSLSVKSSGVWYGGDLTGTLVFRHYFLVGDLSYSLGSLDYSGSGNASNQSTDSWEMRALFGRDFFGQTYAFSPYIGFGYRTLYNDARGITDTGASGYRRQNRLYYIPIGFHPRFHIDSSSRLSSTLEFDYVLAGTQHSYLSDDGLGDPDIYNHQHGGFAIRGDVMWESRTWAFGPYFTYWNINKSDTNFIQDHSNSTCGGSPPCNPGFLEPANNTIEAGVKLKYHFF